MAFRSLRGKSNIHPFLTGERRSVFGFGKLIGGWYLYVHSMIRIFSLLLTHRQFPKPFTRLPQNTLFFQPGTSDFL